MKINPAIQIFGAPHDEMRARMNKLFNLSGNVFW